MEIDLDHFLWQSKQKIPEEKEEIQQFWIQYQLIIGTLVEYIKNNEIIRKDIENKDEDDHKKAKDIK